MVRVIIDAGHGGLGRVGNSSAFGARGGRGTLEKDVTLDIARHVVARLGGIAALTRSDDRNLTLGARAQQAERGGADVFVSIHANSGPPEASGPETFVPPAAGAPSRRLAASVQGALDRQRGRYGSPSVPREGPMAVLAPPYVGVRTSACLAEVDYLSNPRGEERLRNPQERAAIGAAIADAIKEHLVSRGLDRPAPDPYIIPNPVDYAGSGLGDFVRVWASWFGRYASWRAGVPASAYPYFPHSAICELEMTTSQGTAFGTGFYIGSDKILTCGHNFKEGAATTSSVIVRPGKCPGVSLFPEATCPIPDWRAVVHPRWAASEDDDWDMAVFHIPNLLAPNGAYFSLPTQTPAASERIVVCGYGKFQGTGVAFADQGQYMDGATITNATQDQYHFAIQAIPGHSGSPVFWNDAAIAILTGPRMLGGAISDYENRGVLLSPQKLDWINSK
jgi:N-acetylmuramoyl-L-alanine amidase/V8-like Glu-specific endopeptidase